MPRSGILLRPEGSSRRAILARQGLSPNSSGAAAAESEDHAPMDALVTPVKSAVDWDGARRAWRVQILGAGGARGRELTVALLAAGHPPMRLALYGRARRGLSWRGQRLTIEPLPATPPSAELAFLCTPPEVSRELAPRLAARGARVIDLSGGLVPPRDGSLVLAEINGDALGAFTQELALPLPTTALIAPALAVLERAAGLAEVDLFAVVAAAGEGARGILGLRRERGGAPAADGETRLGELRAAERVLPGLEERLVRELRALLGQPDLLLDAHAWVGDLERCDAFALKVLLHAPLEAEAARELFEGAPGLVVEPGGATPEPARVTGSGRIHVGRIRPGSRGPRSLCFSAAGDQLRGGSSLAALRVAARLPAAG
jgi:aspartate-semialdehyde dehydrogenase